MTTATKKDIINSVLEYIDTGDTPNEKHISDVVKLVNENIHMRDFFMGLISEKDSQLVLNYLKNYVDLDSRMAQLPFNAIISTVYYYMGNEAQADKHLGKSLNLDSEYPLSNLLLQVYSQKWPNKIILQMATELHDQVVDRLLEDEEDND